MRVELHSNQVSQKILNVVIRTFQVSKLSERQILSRCQFLSRFKSVKQQLCETEQK